MVVTTTTPKPDAWTAPAESVLEKVQQARTTRNPVVTQ